MIFNTFKQKRLTGCPSLYNIKQFSISETISFEKWFSLLMRYIFHSTVHVRSNYICDRKIIFILFVSSNTRKTTEEGTSSFKWRESGLFVQRIRTSDFSHENNHVPERSNNTNCRFQDSIGWGGNFWSWICTNITSTLEKVKSQC